MTSNFIYVYMVLESELYHDRTEKNKSWQNVAKAVLPNFDGQTHREKNIQSKNSYLTLSLLRTYYYVTRRHTLPCYERTITFLCI